MIKPFIAIPSAVALGHAACTQGEDLWLTVLVASCSLAGAVSLWLWQVIETVSREVK